MPDAISNLDLSIELFATETICYLWWKIGVYKLFLLVLVKMGRSIEYFNKILIVKINTNLTKVLLF